MTNIQIQTHTYLVGKHTHNYTVYKITTISESRLLPLYHNITAAMQFDYRTAQKFNMEF